MKKALLFDFHGVIIDSYDMGISIIREYYNDISDEDFKAHHDGNVFEEPKIDFSSQPLGTYSQIYKSKMEDSFSFFDKKELKDLSKRYDLFVMNLLNF